MSGRLVEMCLEYGMKTCFCRLRIAIMKRRYHSLAAVNVIGVFVV